MTNKKPKLQLIKKQKNKKTKKTNQPLYSILIIIIFIRLFYSLLLLFNYLIFIVSY